MYIHEKKELKTRKQINYLSCYELNNPVIDYLPCYELNNPVINYLPCYQPE